MSSSDSSFSSSLASSLASSAAPPAAAPPAAAAPPPPPPPEGTEASFSEPAAMSYSSVSVTLIALQVPVLVVRCPYLVDVLALKLGDQSVQALIVSLDADGLKDGLDISGRGGGVATKAEEEVSCEMLHCERCLIYQRLPQCQWLIQVYKGCRIAVRPQRIVRHT
jgi:hypothetical protein